MSSAPDDIGRRLLEALWDRDPAYYELARAHVQAASARPGEYDFLRRWLPERGRILEVGCGEGSNMEALAAPGRRFVGCDLSGLALGMARAAAPEDGSRRFSRGAAETLPFAGGSFDAVMAVSLLEHLPAPAAAVGEMIRVLAPGGRLLLLSPQYGGPLGASPCRRGGGAGRFARRLVRAHLPAAGSDLAWDRVEPPVLSGEAYDGDRDAVSEPELTSLIRFVRSRGLRLDAVSSGLGWYTWLDYPGTFPQQAARAVCERLGRLGLPPYRWFGPLVALAASRPEAR